LARLKGSAIRKKGDKPRASSRARAGQCPVRSQVLIVCEKKSGIPRFRVVVDGGQDAALERAATLLALTCSLRGDRPADYEIRVPARDSVKARITKLASELLRLGHAFSSSVSLSPRERQVLCEIMRSRLNKEIAGRLNISPRTVKFHVSALLAKFRVSSRWDLILQAQRMFGVRHSDELIVSPLANLATSRPASEPAAVHKAALSSERIRRDQRRIIPFRGLRPA
jgi:DNA-binding CsgD family transcriptional regulator